MCTSALLRAEDKYPYTLLILGPLGLDWGPGPGQTPVLLDKPGPGPWIRKFSQTKPGPSLGPGVKKNTELGPGALNFA